MLQNERIFGFLERSEKKKNLKNKFSEIKLPVEEKYTFLYLCSEITVIFVKVKRNLL